MAGYIFKYCELWTVLTGLMLDLELPMLRGSTRQAYGMEKNVSPWTIGMAEIQKAWENTKECHMYEFPAEIQECMESAAEYGSDKAIDQLMQYKEKNIYVPKYFFPSGTGMHYL